MRHFPHPLGDVTYAYRELGPKGGIPVVFFVHLAANLDNWDPRIIDPIAKDRHVIAFDNRGVGAFTGIVPDTIAAMAADAVTFIKTLRFEKVDIFSFSLGSMIAQAPVLAHPELCAGSSSPAPTPQKERASTRSPAQHITICCTHPDPVRPEGVPVLQPQHQRQRIEDPIPRPPSSSRTTPLT